MKLLVSIAFYFKNGSDRVKYLYQLLDNYLNNYKIDVKINIETNSVEVIKLLLDKYFDELTMKKIIVNCHMEKYMSHPFDLTRKHRELFVKNIDKYDYFMYVEDDMLIPYEGFIEFTKKFEDLYEENYIPGFVRLEYRDGVYYNTDNANIHNICNSEIIERNNRKYFKIINPYQGFWVLPRDFLKESIKKSGKKFIYKEKHDYIREYMALYPIDELKMVSIVELNNNKIHPNSYIYHLANNYVGNTSGFGSVPIEKLVNVTELNVSE